MNKIISVALLLAALLLFPSCTGRSQGNSSPATAGLRLLSQPVSARDFSLSTINGETITLSELEGKIVFLYFWTTWCGVCRDGMPSLEALHNRYVDTDFKIFAVNVMEGHSTVSDFMDENEFSFTVLLDENGRVSDNYGVQALPTSFIIDRNGMIAIRLLGGTDWDAPNVHNTLESLLDS
jgi:peroxiredoxin